MTGIDQPTTRPDDNGATDAPDVTEALAALVADVDVTAELRDSVAGGLQQRSTHRSAGAPRRFLAVAAAVAILAGGAVALTSTGDDEQHDRVVAADDPTTTSDREHTASTVPDPDAPPATVAGTIVTRPDATTTTTVPDRAEPRAAGAPAAPPTTVLVCRNSTDPACGPFRWEPAPVVSPSAVTIVPPAAPVRAGVPHEIVIELTDEGHTPSFNCASLDIDPVPNDEAWVGLGGCMVVREDCGARFGPWSPPPREGSTIRTSRSVTFDEPGTYTLTVTTQANRGCWDPYGTDATTTATLEVTD